VPADILKSFEISSLLFDEKASSVLDEHTPREALDEVADWLVLIFEALEKLGVVQHLSLELHCFVVHSLVNDVQLWQVVQAELQRKQLEFKFDLIEGHDLKASSDVATGVEVLALHVKKSHALENVVVTQIRDSIHRLHWPLELQRGHGYGTVGSSSPCNLSKKLNSYGHLDQVERLRRENGGLDDRASCRPSKQSGMSIFSILTPS